MATDSRLLRLSPADNIFVAAAAVHAGEEVVVNGQSIRIGITIPLGHKMAARAIASGEKIIKYGAPIGSATCDIAPGEHVHTHNIQSDYLPTYAREGKARYVRED